MKNLNLPTFLTALFFFGFQNLHGNPVHTDSVAPSPTLTDLAVNGRILIDFHPDTLEYRMALPLSVEEVPEVSATASDSAAGVVITPAGEIPGTTLIEVTSEDSSLTYSLDFHHRENIFFDFESGVDPFIDFDGGTVQIIDNPHSTGLNTSGKVGKMVKYSGQVWGGSFIQLEDSIDFSVSKFFTMKVLAPRAGVDVMLKLEHLTRGRIYREVHATTTLANEWEELTFDFSEISGKFPIHKITLIFEMGIQGEGGDAFTFYFDDIRQLYNYDLCLARAGSDQAVVDEDRNGVEEVNLDASASIGSPSVVSYEWYEGGNVIAGGMQPTVNLSTGPHYISLKVTDENGSTGWDAMLVDVREIIWQEDFDSLATETWNFELGDGCDQGPNMCGWGNFELEYYQEENVSIVPLEGEGENHALLLEARKESVANRQFTSGRITTERNVAAHFGILETRIKAPDVEKGLWPSAWLLGVNHRTAGWPVCGEIDLMEMGQDQAFRDENDFPESTGNELVGGNLLWYTADACGPDNPTCAASIAYDHHYCTPYYTEDPLNERFVIYRTYWKESEIRLTVVDGGVEHDFYTGPFPVTDNEEVFRKPFYFILNLAVGGLFTGITSPGDITAPMPASMMIDYVRVLKWNGIGNVYLDYILANAGADQTLTDENGDGKEMVTLDGSGSSYPGGTIISYRWTRNGSEIANGVSPTFELPVGEHIITLTVTGNDNVTSSDDVGVVIESTATGIEEKAPDPFTLYPSPVGDILTIGYERGKVDRIRIFGINGNLILEKSRCSQVDMQGLPSGLYLVELEANGIFFRKKIVKE